MSATCKYAFLILSFLIGFIGTIVFTTMATNTDTPEPVTTTNRIPSPDPTPVPTAWELETKEQIQKKAKKAAAEKAAAEKAAAEKAAAEKAAAEKAAAEKAAAEKAAAKKAAAKKKEKKKSNSGSTYAEKVQSAVSDFCPGTKAIIDASYLNGHQGTADWYNNTVGVRSGLSNWYSVAVHECAHIRQYNAFNGDVTALKSRMNSIYGGSGFEGLEQNADCVALRWGATWTHYTSSCGGKRGSAAASIAAGEASVTFDTALSVV